MTQKTLIVGAGQAGVQVAMSLRQGGYSGEISLVGKEPHVPYQRPPLSKQVLKKEWAAERCQLRHLEFYQQHSIDLMLGVSAVALDAGKQRVRFDDDSFAEYSDLVICTGSRLNRLPVKGADLPGVCYLRTVDEALELAGMLRGGTRLAIIGGGYIGLEVAAAARALDCEVHVIEALDQVMKRSALPEIAEFLHRQHEQNGVLFHMNSKVDQLSGTDRVAAVRLASGESIAADVVMVGVGVRPDLRWLEGSGVDVQRGVRVDAQCRSNLAHVYAAGDVTELQHPMLDGWHVLESVQNAVSQGKIVAAAILGKDDQYVDVPWFWSEQYDSRLQMAGIPREGDQWVERPNSETGGMSIFSFQGQQLNGVQSINSPRDYMVGRQLIAHASAVTPQQLADEHFNLKELL